MVYTPCFEEVYLNIRNQSGCFCGMSFLEAGLYCTVPGVLRKIPKFARLRDGPKLPDIKLKVYNCMMPHEQTTLFNMKLLASNSKHQRGFKQLCFQMLMKTVMEPLRNSQETLRIQNLIILGLQSSLKVFTIIGLKRVAQQRIHLRASKDTSPFICKNWL